MSGPAVEQTIFPDLDKLESRKGTYVVGAHCAQAGEVVIGSLGMLRYQPGFYYYVGSAFGPGGLRARLRHHLQPAGKCHWHYDYLKSRVTVASVWVTSEADRVEHEWAGLLAGGFATTIPLPGFGASDCQCQTHLYHAIKPLNFTKFNTLSRVKCDVIHK